MEPALRLILHLALMLYGPIETSDLLLDVQFTKSPEKLIPIQWAHRQGILVTICVKCMCPFERFMRRTTSTFQLTEKKPNSGIQIRIHLESFLSTYIFSHAIHHSVLKW